MIIQLIKLKSDRFGMEMGFNGVYDAVSKQVKIRPFRYGNIWWIFSEEKIING